MVNSVLVRLFISYVSLVFLVTIVTAVTSSIFFQRSYNRQLEILHNEVVNEIASSIVTRIVDVTKLVYLECATDLLRGTGDFFLEDDVAKGGATKVLATYDYLQSMMAKHQGELTGIALYYRKADLIIGFPEGVHYRDPDGTLADSGMFQWFARQTGNSYWRLDNGGLPLTLRAFPILSNQKTDTVVFSISVDPQLVSAILSRPGVTGATYLVDGDGSIVSASAGAPRLPIQYSRYFAHLSGVTIRDAPAGFSDNKAPYDSTASPDSRVVRVDDRPSLVTALRIADTGWTLLNVTPLAILYQKSGDLRAILSLISFAAVLFGMLVAAIVTARIYNPLAAVLRRVRVLFGASVPLPTGPASAYRLIDSALNDLSSERDELSRTLTRNRPLIIHEITTSLLDGTFVLASIESSLKLLGLTSYPEHYFVAVVSVGEQNQHDRADDSGLARFQIAEVMESASERFVLTAVLHDGTVGVISECGAEPDEMEAIACAWMKELRDRQLPALAISVGKVVQVPSDLHASFEEAKKRAAYRYFFPERSIFAEHPDELRREEKSRTSARHFSS